MNTQTLACKYLIPYRPPAVRNLDIIVPLPLKFRMAVLMHRKKEAKVFQFTFGPDSQGHFTESKHHTAINTLHLDSS